MSYDYKAGTSMATPHVAAVAGLLWSADSTFTSTEVRTFLTDGAEEVGPYAYVGGRNDYMGFGRLNACRSLREAGVASIADCLWIGGVKPLGARAAAASTASRSWKTGPRVSRAATYFGPFFLPWIASGALILRRRMR